MFQVLSVWSYFCRGRMMLSSGFLTHFHPTRSIGCSLLPSRANIHFKMEHLPGKSCSACVLAPFPAQKGEIYKQKTQKVSHAAGALGLGLLRRWHEDIMPRGEQPPASPLLEHAVPIRLAGPRCLRFFQPSSQLPGPAWPCLAWMLIYPSQSIIFMACI